MSNKEFENISSLPKAMSVYGHLPRTQKEALAAGERMYFTAQECRNGHFAPRYTNSKACSRCVKDAVAKARKTKTPATKKRAQDARLVRQKTLREAMDAIPANERLDELLGAYLINEGADALLPGLIKNCRNILNESPWLLSILSKMQEAPTGNVLSDDDSDLIFLPIVTQNNLPSTPQEAARWKQSVIDLPDGQLKTTVACIITTLLDCQSGPYTLRQEVVLNAWLDPSGHESAAEAA